jgi:hypothetical protein
MDDWRFTLEDGDDADEFVCRVEEVIQSGQTAQCEELQTTGV